MRVEGGQRIRGESRPNHAVGKPLISVITVVYNCAATLEQTICSVIEQRYDNIEHIVIDGGSTDGSVDILRRYDDRLEYWLSEKDAGIYDAMNKGVALARGEYVGMLNADDYFAHPLAMEIIVKRLLESRVDAVFSCLDIVNPERPDTVLRKYRVASYSPFMLRIGVMPPHPTFYCRRTCYERAGEFRTDFQIGADFEMLVRLLIGLRISWSFIDATLVIMRAGGVSNRGLRALWTLNREIVRACRDNGLFTCLPMLALKLPIRLRERLR